MIHIAGFPVRIGARYRQLCAWCGHRLQDGDSSNEMSSDGQGLGAWPVGALVSVEGSFPIVSAVVPHADGDVIPAGWCGDERPSLRLVEPSDPTTPRPTRGGSIR